MADEITDEHIWQLEEQFWLGGSAFHDMTVGEDTVMCFGAPLGPEKGQEARKSLDQAPEWTDVEMRDRRISHPTPEVAVTGYTAHATAGEVLYKVYCSSTWVRRNGDWRHVQHQETPV